MSLTLALSHFMMAKKEGGKVRINSIKLHLIGNVYIYSYLIHVTKFFFLATFQIFWEKKKKQSTTSISTGDYSCVSHILQKKKNICKATATLHAILIKHHNPLGHIDLSYGTLMNHSWKHKKSHLMWIQTLWHIRC